jgi:transcriptional regulator with XRE-family HTH domain
MLLGERLRRIREARGMTQSDLHSLTGIVPFHISRVERGHTLPTLETIQKLADALKVPVWNLFYEEEGQTEALFPPRFEGGYGSYRKQARAIQQLRLALSKMRPRERRILLIIAKAMLKEK